MINSLLNNPLMLPIWYSILCGFLVGLERELKNKDAGVRTTIFICVGAAIYAFISTHAATGMADNTRVMAQIVSGIGFIGGGVIIFDKDKIQGLTSAAIIWLVAGIGILNGIGMHLEAVMSSLTIVVMDFTLSKAKYLIKGNQGKEDGTEKDT